MNEPQCTTPQIVIISFFSSLKVNLAVGVIKLWILCSSVITFMTLLVVHLLLRMGNTTNSLVNFTTAGGECPV